MRTALIIVLLVVVLVAAYLLRGTNPKEEKGQTPEVPERVVYTFDGEQDDRGVPSPWQLKVSSGKARFAVRPPSETEKDEVLWVGADKASFFLARADRTFDRAEFPQVSWSWKATLLPLGGDVRKSSLSPFAENKNDQALQLLVTFDNDQVISYMWDTTARVGTEVREQNPFVSIMAVVVESGEEHLGKWRSYRRNLADDYRRLHDGTARSVKGIAVQTNANHTRSRSEGYFGPITFAKE